MKKKQKKSEMPLKDKILSKFTTGRTKSFKKRENTLLYEYKYRNKRNRFIDRRIGEKNRAMTTEDRLMARFAAERIKRHRKKEMYNLGEDEDVVLTHSGRALQDVEKFEDPRSDDDDDYDDTGSGKLQADYVGEAHFGGGLFSKVNNDASTHRNVIDDLISDSKKRKAERQLTRERTSNLTDKLDQDLKLLLPLMSDRKNDGSENAAGLSGKPNSYDMTVNTLKFERIGKPSERTKCEIEIEIEQNRKRKQLEEERIKRMKRPVTDDANDEQDEENDEPVKSPPKTKHQSADDLDDGFDLDDDNDDDGDDNESDDDENEHDSVDNGNDEYYDSNATDEDVRTTDTNHGALKPIIKWKSNFGIQEDEITTNKSSGITGNLDDLRELLHDKSLVDKVIAIKNIMKERHPSAGGSKQHLMEIFPFILQYFDYMASVSVRDCWLFSESVYPLLFDLAQICPDDAALHMFTTLEEKQRTFNEQDEPSIGNDVLPILKLVPILFPTSDYYHPITTPTVAFICQILSRYSVDFVTDITKGVFCATLLLEFVDLSKKYCPEVICYLKKLLQCATRRKYKKQKSDWFHQPKYSNALLISDSFKSEKISADYLRLNVDDLESKTETDAIKIKLLFAVLKLSAQFLNYYSELSASYVIWKPFLTLLDQLPVNKYPSIVKGEIENLRVGIEKLADKNLYKLMAAKKRPKLLRQYEPNIRPVIDGRSFRIISNENRERNKLMHKYKKEMRGAIKEIRKDRSFLAGVKFTEQAKQDAERQAKVRQIYSWGQSQQSELKQLDRKKRRH